MTERKEISPVSDGKTEFNTKIIGILLALILTIGTTIGTMMLNQISETKTEIKELGKKLTEVLVSTGILSAKYENIDRRVTLNEKEIGKLKDKEHGLQRQKTQTGP